MDTSAGFERSLSHRRSAVQLFLEIDRGTAWLPRLRRKFGNYYTYLTSGEFRRDGYRLPQVLIVVPDEGRANVVRGVILYEARVHGCSPLPAWIAIQGTLDERGPAAPVWREVMRWRFEHCFEGFRDPPDSARMVLDLASMRCRRRRSP
ncbi:MAG: hypothetical protein JW850_03580 [Thermoflexales bacterium]|nr:hypothetical protein [Thermoflexales bacterium]